MPFAIIFNQIAVNTQSNNSAISTGQNNLQGWTIQGKSNLAAGQQNGLSAVAGNLNVIVDNDFIDVPLNASELNNPLPNVQA